MITQLKFHNFRVLHDATLPLGRITLLIGPNGSGKSTALEAMRMIASGQTGHARQFASFGGDPSVHKVLLEIVSDDPKALATFQFFEHQSDPNYQAMMGQSTVREMGSTRIFRLSANEIAKPSVLQRVLEPTAEGGNLPSVLTTLNDQFPERFESLNRELQQWLPEFDRVLLDTVGQNHRAFALRTKVGKFVVAAERLSEGTLIAVALLTLSNLPNPPLILGLEEIDRGIHPRLLRDVRDAIMHLAHPEQVGDDRKPVQVVMTSHSPYFVDLFRENPASIVIAEKEGHSASFHRLTEMQNYEEILQGISLGEAWYSGMLGGVPVGT